MRAQNSTTIAAVLLSTLLTFVAAAQTASQQKATAQGVLTTAEAAIASAQSAGAATLAPDLYLEAARRLQVARSNWASNDDDARRVAALRAVEATHAAAAAEAQARLVSTSNALKTLSTELVSLGGTAPQVTLYSAPAIGTRGTTSIDRVIVAENALEVSKSVGGEDAAPADITRAEEILPTARMLAKNDEQSASADHLAFTAEMMARRAEYVARLNTIAPQLSDLRTQRTLLAQQVADQRAEEERARRLEAERQAEELRRQLSVESASRQIEQAELDRLRQQLATQEAEMRAQLEEDREARMFAERSLDDLYARYQTALAEQGADPAEVEALRRQLEDQERALRSLQERERLSETSMANQIESLENALARERDEGRLNAEVLAQREAELQRQRAELERIREEREASEARRSEAEAARAAALAEAQSQTEELREQIAAERARAAQTEAELARAREELARRDAENQQRITAMQTELAKLAETRTTDRGLIVTLPGLFFDTGRYALKAGARNTLSKIADQLRGNDTLTIAIEGHTDSVGGDAMNQELSEKRADSVGDYLVSRGIPAARMTVTGRGETAPIATNDTPAGRQQNRRVELVITQ